MGRAIDVDKLCADLMERWDIADKQKEELVKQVMADIVTPIVVSQPTVEPERKRGKWIDGRCDQCDNHAPFWPMATTYYESNFCPNCGAEMK